MRKKLALICEARTAITIGCAFKAFRRCKKILLVLKESLKSSILYKRIKYKFKQVREGSKTSLSIFSCSTIVSYGYDKKPNSTCLDDLALAASGIIS